MVSSLLYNVHPSAATASKPIWLCSESDLGGLVFSETSELLTPLSAV